MFFYTKFNTEQNLRLVSFQLYRHLYRTKLTNLLRTRTLRRQQNLTEYFKKLKHTMPAGVKKKPTSIGLKKEKQARDFYSIVHNLNNTAFFFLIFLVFRTGVWEDSTNGFLRRIFFEFSREQLFFVPFDNMVDALVW